MEMDWKEILRFSQKELKQNEKEKLCESLSWMEVDDIDLNFIDLKTLFKLAQDILKYKNEQVNSLLGKSKRKIKTKEKGTITDLPAMSSDTILESIAHQEEVIKANKEVLEQLYADIAKLEGRKNKFIEENVQLDSDSSRNTLSEINTIAQLENEVSKRNKHIRKLFADIKILQEENTNLKDKLLVFKDKLREATLLIENLTEQLFTINKNNTNLKEHLAKTEQEKVYLSIELENLKQELNDKDLQYEKVEESVKNKIQEFKKLVESQSEEIKFLSKENTRLKENMNLSAKKTRSPKKISQEETKLKKLQEKLTEASEEMLKSANIIQILKSENKQLKDLIDDGPELAFIPDQKNESDDGKQKNMILQLKQEVKKLQMAFQNSEELIASREKELADTTEQLQMLKTEESINTIIESIKQKKRDMKIQEQGIKSLVQEVNSLSELVNELQLENETMRENLQIPSNIKIATHGILKKIKDLKDNNMELKKMIQNFENKLVSAEINNHEKDKIIIKLKGTAGNINNDLRDVEQVDRANETNIPSKEQNINDMRAIFEENEGLRNGLTEILNFLKDISNTSPGIITLQCPSFEALLNSMEARKSAGWFSPHMKTVMELKAALGGKDALLGALHESRNETFKIMTELSKQEQKTCELEKILNDINTNRDKKLMEDKVSSTADISVGEFGSWMTQTDYEIIDLKNPNDIKSFISKGHVNFENHYKQALQYFHNKFAVLFDKFKALTVSSIDDQNKWNLQEEHYKAEIENLKSQIDEDDNSNLSPGLIGSTVISTDRKHAFLEESYKHIRTLNENIKNDYLEYKKDKMNEAFEYEKKIQNLILSIITLSDKLRCTIPIDLFLKQNDVLNKTLIEYRNALDMNIVKYIDSEDLVKKLEENRLVILESVNKDLANKSIANKETQNSEFAVAAVENAVIQKQLQETCKELQNKSIQLEKLKKKIQDLQVLQSEIIDKTIHLESCENVKFFKDQIQKLSDENYMLKQAYQDISNKLDNTTLELEAYRNKELSNDKEINMLRHQILDLQSTGDAKAIIARINGEILMAQMQSSQNQNTIETLKLALNKEKQLRAETEDILMNRQNVFDIYTLRYDAKLRNMVEVIDILRQQYQGSLPLISIENFVNKIEELQHKSKEFDEKLNDIEDLQSSLITKHSVYDQVLNMSANCGDNGEICSHKIKHLVTEETQKLEMEHHKRKLLFYEQSHKKILERCNYLERTLLFVNQSFKISDVSSKNGYHRKQKEYVNLKLEDINSDEESSSRKSRTKTLSHPKIDAKHFDVGKNVESKLMEPKLVLSNQTNDKQTQTLIHKTKLDMKSTQTESDQDGTELKSLAEKLTMEKKQKDKLLSDLRLTVKKHEEELSRIAREKEKMQNTLTNLSDANKQKDKLNSELQKLNETLSREVNNLRADQEKEICKFNETVSAEHEALLAEIKTIETDKNKITADYKQLLNKERENYAKSLKAFQIKLKDLQIKLDKREEIALTSKDDGDKETNNKYTMKITDLEEKCFRLESELDGYKTEFESQQGELERWKSLASERLTKMEQLSAQLKERHNQEVESYKAENQHWLVQLKETQREHIELRTRLTEQRTAHLKQINERDSHIEQLRSVVNSLKSQIVNMQTMLTLNDPNFDLSAIVEVEEASDGVSQGSERLELKFESTVDLNETPEDIKIPCASTAIWQEPIVDRLRREKQLMNKQNGMLRRQIKVLAARERRSRLDAQNLRNQVFRISTLGNKVPSAESAAMQSKIASLQAQLTSARRDAHSHVALWDKWKRSQQAADRWQARFEEKCQEVKKLEMSLNLSKSAVTRLEKEKRILLSKITDDKQEKHLAIEKQEVEESEKILRSECLSPPPVSARALLGRVEAQQRRIAALEIAERGNETLVSEYEKTLAEVASLKGQVLKLESTLLEAQIRAPATATNDAQPELQYWKNYCDMLKEENKQLTLRVNSLESVPASAQHQRVSDLEQTILTLRGLVSKLQSEQKSSSCPMQRRDSRPSSGRSGTDKIRSQLDSYRTEISNLKRSISEKDTLLEKSKDMLRVAAEREDDLLRENLMLRRRLEQLSEGAGGFMSV